MDESEDSSVTAAIVNVVCELGWRRPQDFLPLAPRLFDLLVDGGNNWMAIKIIKLVGFKIKRVTQLLILLILLSLPR
jgi:AP-3 complex subunit delta